VVALDTSAMRSNFASDRRDDCVKHFAEIEEILLMVLPAM